MLNEKRHIAVLVGSDSDLLQCEAGLMYLLGAVREGLCTVRGVWTASIHRNTDYVLQCLRESAKSGLDLLITGAGMANHLSGTSDAYLRNTLKNDTLHVIGVAFEDLVNPLNTRAARLSITQVPGTQVLYSSPDDGDFIGPGGFEAACRFAVTGTFPAITLKEPKPLQVRSLDGALSKAREMAVSRR